MKCSWGHFMMHFHSQFSVRVLFLVKQQERSLKTKLTRNKAKKVEANKSLSEGILNSCERFLTKVSPDFIKDSPSWLHFNFLPQTFAMWTHPLSIYPIPGPEDISCSWLLLIFLSALSHFTEAICTTADEPALTHILLHKQPFRSTSQFALYYDRSIQLHSHWQTPLSSFSHQEMDLWSFPTRPTSSTGCCCSRSVTVCCCGLNSAVLNIPWHSPSGVWFKFLAIKVSTGVC